LKILNDSKLNFKYHLNLVESKLSRAVGILYKAVLPREALLKLYYALVHPYLLYGLVAWGSTYFSYLQRISTFQNKAVKIVEGGNFRDHATQFY